MVAQGVDITPKTSKKMTKKLINSNEIVTSWAVAKIGNLLRK